MLCVDDDAWIIKVGCFLQFDLSSQLEVCRAAACLVLVSSVPARRSALHFPAVAFSADF